MRSLIIVAALTLPCLALASEDDPFGDDEDYDAPKAKTQPGPQAKPQTAPQPRPQPPAAAAPVEQPAAPAAVKAEAPPPPPPPPPAKPQPAPAKASEAKANDAPRRLQQQPATPTGPVAVLVTPLDPAANEGAFAFERQLASAFAAEGRLAPLDLDRKLASAPAAEAPEIQAHLDAGRTAFDNLELDAAAEEYLAAIKLMLEQPASAVPGRIAHAFTLSGAAYALNGDAKRAETAFRHAAVIAPDWTPPASEFSPDIIEAFTAARTAAAAGPKGSVEVTANATPAIVFVDGREAGIAPLKAEGLPAGRHHVLVKSRAHAPWATFVMVADRGAASTAVTLEAQPQAASLARGQRAALAEAAAGRGGPGAQELGTVLGASYLVLGTARTDPSGTLVEYQALEVATGRVAGSGKRAVIPGAPSLDADLNALAPQLSSAFLDPILVAEKPEVSKPLKERWWFWPAVGGVAAVAVGAAVYGIVAASGPSGAPTLVTTGIP